MNPTKPNIKISDLGEKRTFVSGTDNWRIEWAELNGKRFEAGVSVKWRCPDDNRSYAGKIQWLIIYDGQIDVSIDNPKVGRLGLEEIQWVKGKGKK